MLATQPNRSDMKTGRASAATHPLSWLRAQWGVIALVLITIPLALLFFRWLGYDLAAFTFNPIGDRADTIFNSWTIAQAIDNLIHRPLQLGYAPILSGDANAFNYTIAPYGIALVVMPLYFLTGQNIALTYNIYLVATFTLTALSVYWLVRYLVRPPIAVAVVIGLLIAFLPYRDLQMHHIETLSMQFFFFTLYAFHRLLDTSRWRWAIALAILFCLTMLTSGYLGFTLLVAFGLLAIFLILRSSEIVTRRLIICFIGAGIIIATVLAPFLASRLGNPTFSRGYALLEIEWYSGTFIGWFSSLALIYHNIAPFQEEGTLFMGFVPLTLSVVAWFSRRRLSRSTGSNPPVEADDQTQPAAGSPWFPLPRLIAAYAILIIAGYILSLGPQIPLTPQGGLPGPYLLLMQIPGFDYLRVPARFIMLAITGIAILSTYTLTVLYRTQRRWVYRLMLVIVTVALAAECVPTPLDGSGNVILEVARAFNSERLQNSQPEFTNPDAYSWLAGQPGGTVVFHYPLGKDTEQAPVEEQYIYDQLQYKQPIVNGWGSTLPDWYLHTDWTAFPDAATVTILQQRHVKYVLIHNEHFSDADRSAFITRLSAWQNTTPQIGQLTLVKHFAQIDVYSLQAGS